MISKKYLNIIQPKGNTNRKNRYDLSAVVATPMNNDANVMGTKKASMLKLKIFLESFGNKLATKRTINDHKHRAIATEKTKYTSLTSLTYARRKIPTVR